MRSSMRLVTVLAAAVGLTLAPLAAVGAENPPGAGAAGVGDPYFPLDGNGGFDVQNYDLGIDYNPDTDRLVGTATLRARATQQLSSFHLDLVGLTVASITVDGAAARFRRNGQELIITPARSLGSGAAFTVVVKYAGVPQPVPDVLGAVGFTAYAEGAYVAGQPHGAAGWFPVSDHPIDKAAYTFRVTAPSGLDVVANGVLTDRRTQGARTTWTWTAKEPMASYLTTLAIGAYDVRSYRSGGIQYVDAVADGLAIPFTAPRTGAAFALSNAGLSGYSRLSRVISVPAGGADLSFQLARQVEPDYDYVFVEAHTVGADDWTTLPDRNGHTSQDVGQACLYGWSFIHPFLEHYQTIVDDETCLSSGTTGQWWGATGASEGYEAWSVDLAPYAGRDVEVSITYVTDDLVLGSGAFVDDVVVSTGAGTTSFESDGDVLDGWQVPGAPAGSPGNVRDWVVGTAGDVPTLADQANTSLARQPEIIRFLASRFGPYPFSAAGGIVVADDALGFALETQTRPIYSPAFFGSAESGDSVIVHELAHQWFGDSLAVQRWKDIWLNEGFATYAEWLWSEREGGASAQEIFDFYASRPADDGFWQLTIGDPGPEQLFDGAVYNRGAMTLHALRLELGDGRFFTLLKRWTDRNAGANVATTQFIAMAEQVGGRQLDAFFDAWLYTAAKPAGIEPAAAARAAAGQAVPQFTADISRRLAKN